MRFWTIWTIPAMTVRERLARTREWAASEIAAHLPLRVKYWCTLQMVAKATRTSENIPGTPLEDILKDLDRPRRIA